MTVLVGGSAPVGGNGLADRAPDPPDGEQPPPPAGLSENRKALIDRYTVEADHAAPAARQAVVRQVSAGSTTASLPLERLQVGEAEDAGAEAWRWFPLLMLSSAVGLAVCVLGDALSRSTRSSSQLLFWVGLMVIVVPVVLRIVSPRAVRGERVALVVLLGLSLYLVKVAWSPFALVMTDELAHAPNSAAILRTHGLFHPNPILPVTAYYPGLESLVAALASMTGLTIFGAGVVVIGVARVVTMLALYLLFERLSGSSRIAGLGAAIYTANSSFLFFDAQVSYESLALPLLVFVLFAIAEWRRDENRGRWVVVGLVPTLAIVVTHHVTTYGLILLLLALCVAQLLVARTRFHEAPWRLLLVAALATTAWLTLVASYTVSYLTPVFTNALVSTFHTVAAESGPRKLFSAGHGYQAPLLERAVGLGSYALMAAALPFGLRIVRRRYRNDPYALVLGVLSVAFFGVAVLRLAPDAWETAKRSTEFLFIGLGFVLALTGLDRWAPRRAAWVGRTLTAAFVGVIFAGGVISGWPPALRLSQPYRVEAGAHSIEPEGRQLARWAAANIRPGSRYAASDADARLLATYAAGAALAGNRFAVANILHSSKLPAWQIAGLERAGVRYVVVDRRSGSFGELGYFFPRRRGGSPADSLLPAGVATRFDRQGADRLYDSGTIKLYDLAGPAYAKER